MPDRYLVHPLRYGAQNISGTDTLRNGLAVTDDVDQHLLDKILAVLFTNPGERVNNPRFGVGINRVVFEGLNELTISAVEFRVSEGLRRDVGDEILLERVDIESLSDRGELRLMINYRRREDRAPRNLEIRL